MTLFQNLFASLFPELSQDQQKAMELLMGEGNVFITGGAGTGKSYLMRKFLHKMNPESFPVLASTGAAAVLVGGRTFHSFFGLGIMEGGAQATLDRAFKNRRITRRLKKVKGIVVDEISMIPGQALEVAEQIARLARDSSEPWGGIRIIAVGDFAQLPPVSRTASGQRDWAFLQPVWERTQFQCMALLETMRTKNNDFAQILNSVRVGQVSPAVKELLDFHTILPADDLEGTYLFARREDAQRVNHSKLAQLEGKLFEIATTYQGEERFVQSLQNNAPIPAQLQLKKNALIMIRQNDPMGRWVNGSLGFVEDIFEKKMHVKLMSGVQVLLEKTRFSLLDAEGNEVASAENFPVNLAYAITIHKAQGATLDRAIVNLQNLWEPGQAYVALSRVRNSDDLMIDGWSPRSIIADPKVKDFHRKIMGVKEAENLVAHPNTEEIPW